MSAGREFTCTDCDLDIFQAIDDGFGFPVCFTCRWLSNHPEIDKATADRVRYGLRSGYIDRKDADA